MHAPQTEMEEVDEVGDGGAAGEQQPGPFKLFERDEDAAEENERKADKARYHHDVGRIRDRWGCQEDTQRGETKGSCYGCGREENDLDVISQKDETCGQDKEVYHEAEDHARYDIPEDDGVDGDRKGEEPLVGARLLFPGGDQGADRRGDEEEEHGQKTREIEVHVEPLAEVKGEEHEEGEEEAEYDDRGLCIIDTDVLPCDHADTADKLHVEPLTRHGLHLLSI